MWDVLEEAAVSNYRGHSGYLLSVDWSPVDPDVIWTGGKDFTVQEWKVSEQEFTKPPKGKPGHEAGVCTLIYNRRSVTPCCGLISGKKTILLQEKKQKKKSKTASGSVGSVETKVNGEPVTEDKTVRTEQGQSEDEEEEVRSTNSLESPAGMKTFNYRECVLIKIILNN